MKKLMYGGLFLAVVGIGFIACEKAEVDNSQKEVVKYDENELIVSKSACSTSCLFGNATASCDGVSASCGCSWGVPYAICGVAGEPADIAIDGFNSTATSDLINFLISENINQSVIDATISLKNICENNNWDDYENSRVIYVNLMDNLPISERNTISDWIDNY